MLVTLDYYAEQLTPALAQHAEKAESLSDLAFG